VEGLVKAYKFFRRGAIAPISGVPWPVAASGPGPWVEVGGPLSPCRSGLHACCPESLAYWLHDELWEVELDGELARAEDLLVARRARLVRRLDAWCSGVAARFLVASRAHAAGLAAVATPAGKERARMWIEASDRHVAQGNVAVGAYTAAMGVARLDGEVADLVRFRDERLWQSGFIAAELGLSAAVIPPRTRTS
jgi:hypothetical protein